MTITPTTVQLPVWLNPDVIPNEAAESVREVIAELEPAVHAIVPLLVKANAVIDAVNDQVSGLPEGVWQAVYDAVGAEYLYGMLHLASHVAADDQLTDEGVRDYATLMPHLFGFLLKDEEGAR